MNTKTEILIGFAEMCGERLTDTRMKAYLFALKDLSVDELKASVFKLMNDPSLTRFPMPGRILENVRPQISTEDDAKEAAARIIHAVSKFGWCNRQEARAYIGELGWQVVEMQGGWVSLCENMRPNMIPSLQAQFRELAKTVHAKAKLGILDLPPSLPGQPSQQLKPVKQNYFPEPEDYYEPDPEWPEKRKAKLKELYEKVGIKEMDE